MFNLEDLEQLWLTALQAKSEGVLFVRDQLRQISKYEQSCWQKVHVAEQSVWH